MRGLIFFYFVILNADGSPCNKKLAQKKGWRQPELSIRIFAL